MSDFTIELPTIPRAQPRSAVSRADPRARMAERLPGWLQPFLTWLTARPAPGEEGRERPAWSFVAEALTWTVGGIAMGAMLWTTGQPWAWALLPLALVATTSGLGMFQVVVFHHCSHGTVFATRRANRDVGRFVSALLLFKHFDAYQREHMLHHNARKLLTEEDEFADFVLGMCGLEPEVPKRELWRRVLVNVVVSPLFHLRFLQRRVRAAWASPDRLHNLTGMAAWGLAAALCAHAGWLLPFLVLWVLPVTLLLQLATVGRILCEHRFPEPALIQARGREFVCRATAGVFVGSTPPEWSAATPVGFAAWTLWWLEMLTLQLFVRVFVLVGDAPCHDFHHRRPVTPWTAYIHARQKDVDSGCPGFPLNYGETWGLFRAIDENLQTLADTPRSAIGVWDH